MCCIEIKSALCTFFRVNRGQPAVRAPGTFWGSIKLRPSAARTRLRLASRCLIVPPCYGRYSVLSAGLCFTPRNVASLYEFELRLLTIFFRCSQIQLNCACIRPTHFHLECSSRSRRVIKTPTGFGRLDQSACCGICCKYESEHYQWHRLSWFAILCGASTRPRNNRGLEQSAGGISKQPFILATHCTTDDNSGVVCQRSPSGKRSFPILTLSRHFQLCSKQTESMTSVFLFCCHPNSHGSGNRNIVPLSARPYHRRVSPRLHPLHFNKHLHYNRQSRLRAQIRLATRRPPPFQPSPSHLHRPLQRRRLFHYLWNLSRNLRKAM